MQDLPQATNSDNTNDNSLDKDKRNELLSERSKKETELQILRNQLHGDERDLEHLEWEINRLEVSIAQAERDMGKIKEQINTLERSGKWHSETAHSSEMGARELKDTIFRKKHDEGTLDREVVHAKQVHEEKERTKGSFYEIAQAKQKYEEKNRALGSLHDEVRHLEQELQLKLHQANVGNTSLHSGGVETAQLETNMHRLEGERRRAQSDLKDKQQEAGQLKRKVERLKSEEQGAVNELQQMM